MFVIFMKKLGRGRDEFEAYGGCLGTMNYEQVGYCMNTVIVIGFTYGQVYLNLSLTFESPC